MSPQKGGNLQFYVFCPPITDTNSKIKLICVYLMANLTWELHQELLPLLVYSDRLYKHAQAAYKSNRYAYPVADTDKVPLAMVGAAAVAGKLLPDTARIPDSNHNFCNIRHTSCAGVSWACPPRSQSRLSSFSHPFPQLLHSLCQTCCLKGNAEANHKLRTINQCPQYLSFWKLPRQQSSNPSRLQ